MLVALLLRRGLQPLLRAPTGVSDTTWANAGNEGSSSAVLQCLRRVNNACLLRKVLPGPLSALLRALLPGLVACALLMA